MNNAELIKELRRCGTGGDLTERCWTCDYYDREPWCEAALVNDAADALEAADKRIAELEAQMPKEGEWIGIDGTMFSECSVCGERHYGCETPFCDMCGAKMRTVTDCHTLEEVNR